MSHRFDILVPLNYHKKFDIFVHAEQEPRPTMYSSLLSRKKPAKSLTLKLKVDVKFYSGDRSGKIFPGFSILQCFNIEDLSSTALTSTICDQVLNYAYVPFDLDEANYRETRFISNKKLSSNSTLVAKDVLIKRLSSFLEKVMMDSANTGSGVVGANLRIEKWIILKEKELESMMGWYEGRSKAFQKEYDKFVTRPRTRNYKLDEHKINAWPQPCSICLEDLLGDGRSLILDCCHTFHNDCINQWMETSTLCPLCRYDMTTFWRKPKSRHLFLIYEKASALAHKCFRVAS